MKWVDELPGRPYQRRRGFYQPRGDNTDLYNHAAELLKHPRRWAEYPRHIASPKQARDIVTYIQEGKLGAYPPNGGFEATYRGDKIYIRHNPDVISPVTKAFYEGMAQGRLEVLQEVKRVFGDFHQTLVQVPGWDIARPPSKLRADRVKKVRA